MPHPLDGVRAKLARADAHLKEIKTAIQGGGDPDPDLLPGVFDPKSGHYVFRAKRDSRHPMALGPVVGDFVHNVMAALDYLVVELVLIAKNQPTGANAFPIFTDPRRYIFESAPKTRGVPPDSLTVFEQLQPFYGPNSNPLDPKWKDPAKEPLWYLYTLDKRDKHNALNLTEDVIATHLVGLERYGIRTAPTPGVIAGRFERDAPVAAIELAQPDMEVYLSAAYDIAFDRGGPAAGEPVIQVLDDIRKVVRGRVLPAFAPYFPPE